VVDPRRVRLIAETRRKNDRANDRVLAELARTGALLPPLTLPSEQEWILRARLVVRRGFVAQRSAILCRAGALLRSGGIRVSTRGASQQTRGQDRSRSRSAIGSRIHAGRAGGRSSRYGPGNPKGCAEIHLESRVASESVQEPGGHGAVPRRATQGGGAGVME